MRIIGGEFKGRILKSPASTTTRPTSGMVREALFNICQDTIVGAQVLDLFAGSGSIGLEALSRGAKRAVFVENHREAIRCIQENIHALKVEDRATVYPISYAVALKTMKKKGECFDWIYIDPPYRDAIGPVLKMIKESVLIHPQGRVFVEQRFSSDAAWEEKGFECQLSRRFGDTMLLALKSLLC